eukprot:1958129-Amphidinium_carterae.1
MPVAYELQAPCWHWVCVITSASTVPSAQNISDWQCKLAPQDTIRFISFQTCLRFAPFAILYRSGNAKSTLHFGGSYFIFMSITTTFIGTPETPQTGNPLFQKTGSEN